MQEFEDLKKHAADQFSPVEHPLLRVVAPSLLSTHTGHDGTSIWVGIYNDIYKLVTIYDVSSKPGFYGKGSMYHCLAGRDASRNLAKMELDSVFPKLTDLEPVNKKSLLEWALRFDKQYPVIGHLHPHETGLSLPFSGKIFTRKMLDQHAHEEQIQEGSDGIEFIPQASLSKLRNRNNMSGFHGKPIDGNNNSQVDTLKPRSRSQFSIFVTPQPDSPQSRGQSMTKNTPLPGSMSMDEPDGDVSTMNLEGLSQQKQVSHSMDDLDNPPTIPGFSLVAQRHLESSHQY